MNRIELLKQTFPSWAEVGPCQKTEGHQEYIDLPAYEGQTLLEYAIRSRSVESLGKVLELGADPNGKNLQGETPLNIAIQLSFKKAVRILIDNGADIELTGKDGKKPILNALQCAGSGNTDIIEALLKENVKIDEVDNNW
jgi:ankyrin repeat protein